jgi:L-type amino acid transporter 9
VAGEIHNPSKDLPSAINYALPFVVISYLVANVSYYIIIPWSNIGSTDTIAVVSIIPRQEVIIAN